MSDEGFWGTRNLVLLGFFWRSNTVKAKFVFTAYVTLLTFRIKTGDQGALELLLWYNPVQLQHSLGPISISVVVTLSAPSLMPMLRRSLNFYLLCFRDPHEDCGENVPALAPLPSGRVSSIRKLWRQAGTGGGGGLCCPEHGCTLALAGRQQDRWCSRGKRRAGGGSAAAALGRGIIMGRTATVATCALNQWALDFDGNLERILQSKPKRLGCRLKPVFPARIFFLAALCWGNLAKKSRVKKHPLSKPP